MFNWIKEKIAAIKAWFSNLVNKFPGGGIMLATLALNGAAMYFSNGVGILFTSALAGLILCVSLGFLYFGAPQKYQKTIDKLASKFTWHADVILTFILAYIGFSLGATMAIAACFLGINISGMFAFFRWKANKIDEGYMESALAIADANRRGPALA